MIFCCSEALGLLFACRHWWCGFSGRAVCRRGQSAVLSRTVRSGVRNDPHRARAMVSELTADSRRAAG
ncbi:hypothetical protein KCP75_25390 [Salmonella enterica subsp. enterica]|nr:hypothetical protein KCP75_25390 [Salmonella enterica subsp. enterica]